MTKPNKCDLCDNDFGVNSKGYVVRRKVATKLVCSRCARSHDKIATFNKKYTLGIDYKTHCDICQSYVNSMKNENGEFVCNVCTRIKKRIKREKISYKERKKLEKDIRAYKKERSEYLKSIPPEEFIAIVMGDEEDEM